MKLSAALAAAMLLLAGCSAPSTDAMLASEVTESAEPSAVATAAKPSPSARPSRTTAPAATAPPAVDVLKREEQLEEVFLDQVRTAHPNLEFREGDGMMVIGESFCTMYDNGAVSDDVNKVILAGQGFAYTLDELVTIHGAGVGALCPEHMSKLG